jgi:hypothetical protein
MINQNCLCALLNNLATHSKTRIRSRPLLSVVNQKLLLIEHDARNFCIAIAIRFIQYGDM